MKDHFESLLTKLAQEYQSESVSKKHLAEYKQEIEVPVHHISQELEHVKQSYQSLAQALDAKSMVSEQTLEQKISDLRHEFSKLKTQLGIKDEQTRVALEQLAVSGRIIAERQAREAEHY